MQRLKFIISSVVFLLLGLQYASCQSNYSADSLNQIMFDTTIQQDIMIGKYNYYGLINSHIFKEFVDIAEKEYVPYTDFLLDYKDSLINTNITIVFGSWCSDSQREVPRLLMILKSLDYPMNKLTIIAVNRQKTLPQENISDLYVEYVPTFIFYKGKYEVGRIIEQPSESLEADIASFLFID